MRFPIRSQRRGWVLSCLLVLASIAPLACSSDVQTHVIYGDAVPDVRADVPAQPDVVPDTSADVVPADVVPDTSADVPADVVPDTSADVPADVVPADVVPDTSADVPADVVPDTSADVPADVVPDTSADVPADVPADIPPDVPPDIPEDTGEATETRCFDGLDDDGDGATDCADPDCDGAIGEGACDTELPGICAAGRPVCADGALQCHPLRTAEPEVCGDGVDQDCDGEDLVCPTDEDLDGDGFTVDDGDCNDQNRLIHPDAEEICDGLDNDCSGGTDEGLVSDEVCDGLDNDCDGAVDEGIEGGCLPCVALARPECLPYEVRPCGTHEGQCVEGREMCGPDSRWTGDCLGEVGPTDEVANGLDDDCDGEADEGFWPVSEPCLGQGSAVWRVDPAAADGGDGLSWGTAFATLPDALAAAGPCDDVWLRSGDYSLEETLVVDEAVRLLGGFSGGEAAPDERDPLSEESVIDGGEALRCLDVTADLLLDRVTVANCRSGPVESGAAIRLFGAAILLREAVVRDNRAGEGVMFEDNRGGALYAEDAVIHIVDSVLRDNWAYESGGGIAALRSELLVRSSLFARNVLPDKGEGGSNQARGGAIVVRPGVTTVVIDSRFEFNRAREDGGAILQLGGGTLHVMGCAFEGNRAFIGSPGVASVADGQATIVNSTFVRNAFDYEDSGYEGVLANSWRSVMEVVGCEFSDNVETAIVNHGGNDTATISVADCTFRRNRGAVVSFLGYTDIFNCRFEEHDWYSAPLELWSSLSTITDCEFRHNATEGRGGGASISDGGARFERCVFDDNYSYVTGGAMRVERGAVVDIVNTVMTRNQTRHQGNILDAQSNSVVRLLHVTAVDNVSAYQTGVSRGSALYAEYGSVISVTNSVLWGNRPARLRRDSSSSEIVVRNSFAPEYIGWDDPEDGNLFGDPLLVAAADPTAPDFRLSAYSPGRDAGALTWENVVETLEPLTLPETDIAGRPRVLDADGDGAALPDLGAFEWEALPDNSGPIALVDDERLVAANGVPLSEVELDAGRTCDPEGDELAYRWYGPTGPAEGPAPMVRLPAGRSLVTLVTEDGDRPSNPSTAIIETYPCLDLELTGDGAGLAWTPAGGTAAVLRAEAPSGDGSSARFVSVADGPDSGAYDLPAEDRADAPALYAVVTTDGHGARCASPVVAVGTTGPPVIYSAPSSYTLDPYMELETPEAYDARFGVPYGYHVRAVRPATGEGGDTSLSYALVAGPPGMEMAEDGFLSWRPDRTGSWTVTVSVEDGLGQSATQSFVLRVENRPPVADAGGYRAIGEGGQIVTLDGSRSFDPDGAAVSWRWELTAVPQASEATLEDAGTATPTLTTDMPGVYVARLVVDDGELESAPDEAVVETFDARPWAAISGIATREYFLGELLELDGSHSLDTDGLPIAYAWRCIERPEGSVAELSDPSAVRPTFLLDAFGTFWFELIVSDGTRTSWPRRQRLEVINRAPEVDLGPNRSILLGERQSFDASRCYDPDGFPLTYRWELIPAYGSAALLEGPGGETGIELETDSVAFTPDVVGTFRLDLRVYDAHGKSRVDSVWLTAVDDNQPPEITSAPVTGLLTGQPWSYEPVVRDPDEGDTHVWTLAVGPEGMTLDEATGTTAWTPTREDVGAHEVAIEVADEGGLVAYQAFALAVTEMNEPPGVSCPGTLTALAGQPFGHRVRAVDPNGDDTLTFRLDQGPAGMTLDEEGALRWTPAAGDAGEHPVSLVVADVAGAESGCAFQLHVTAVDADDADFDGYSPDDGDCDDEDPRVHPGAQDIAGDGLDQDCQGGDAAASLAADGPVEHRTLVVGETAVFDHVVHVDGGAARPVVSHRVDPDDGGLVLDAAAVPDGSFDGGRTAPMTLSVEAVAAGRYEVVTTVEDSAAGLVAEAVTPVVVVEGPVRAVITAPVFEPGAVEVDTRGGMTLTVRIEEADAKLAGVLIEELGDDGEPADDPVNEPLWLEDDGGGFDLAPGDGVFTGLLAYYFPVEGELLFRAVPVLKDGTRGTATVCRLPVTRFPIGPPMGDIGRTVFHPDSGAEMVADRLLVQFGPDVTNDGVEAVAAAQGAEVIGFLPGFGLYVLQVAEAADGATLMDQRAALLAEGGVVDAEPSLLAYPAEVELEDPLWGQQQDWAQAIQLEKAWVLGRTIPAGTAAIVDSGIDPHHPDFRDNHHWYADLFCPGGATACGGARDNKGHGTYVAGVLAAKADDEGLSGVAPGSRPVIVAASDGNGNTTLTHLATGMRRAAGSGASFVNCSFGGFRWQLPDPLLFTMANFEVASAGGLVIAAAGNEATTLSLFPAASPNALAVGGVGADASRRWEEAPARPEVGTNYGNWVDIAAPAKDVFTTRPTYDIPDPRGPERSWLVARDCHDYEGTGVQPSQTARRAHGCFGAISGTSLGTPMVTGAAVLVKARLPHLPPRHVATRLKATASPLTGWHSWGLGSGLLDVFQAVFNGSFEADEAPHHALVYAAEHIRRHPEHVWGDDPSGCFTWSLSYRPRWSSARPPPANHGWHVIRFVGVDTYAGDFHDVEYAPRPVRVRRLGTVRPVHGEWMAMISNGAFGETEYTIYGLDMWEGEYVNARYAEILEQRFTVEPGQAEVRLGFSYDFVTEERASLGERGAGPDGFWVELEIGDTREMLVERHVCGLSATGLLSELPEATLGEGVSVRHTGWQTAGHTFAVPEDFDGTITLRFGVSDGMDRAYDSALLVDDVWLE